MDLAVDLARPDEIEPWTNRHVVHPLSRRLLRPAIRAGIHPNLVTLGGLVCGLSAAIAYSRWQDWPAPAVGLFLMLGWHVLDGLDGQLARATGRTSAAGRLLDGLADYATFVAVYCALAFTHPDPWLAVPAAAAAGVAHALQSAFYEGERATFQRRLGHRFMPEERPLAGGPFERLYNRGEAWLGNRARPLDHLLAHGGARSDELDRRLAIWRPAAARVLRRLEPLSANGRTLAIFAAVALLGDPVWFWAFETIILTALAWAGWHGLRQAEHRAIATGG